MPAWDILLPRVVALCCGSPDRVSGPPLAVRSVCLGMHTVLHPCRSMPKYCVGVLVGWDGRPRAGRLVMSGGIGGLVWIRSGAGAALWDQELVGLTGKTGPVQGWSANWLDWLAAHSLGGLAEMAPSRHPELAWPMIFPLPLPRSRNILLVFHIFRILCIRTRRFRLQPSSRPVRGLLLVSSSFLSWAAIVHIVQSRLCGKIQMLVNPSLRGCGGASRRVVPR